MRVITFKANFKFITIQATPPLLLFSFSIITYIKTACVAFTSQIWHWGLSQIPLCWAKHSLSKNQPPDCSCFCSDFQTEVTVTIHHKKKSCRTGITTAAQAGTHCTKPSQNAVVLDLVLHLFMREAQTLREDTDMTLQAPQHPSKPEDADDREHLWKMEWKASQRTWLCTCTATMLGLREMGLPRCPDMGGQNWVSSFHMKVSAPWTSTTLLCQLSDIFAKYWKVGGHYSLETVHTEGLSTAAKQFSFATGDVWDDSTSLGL